MKFFALIALIGLTQGIQLNQLADPVAAPATPDAGADAAKANEEKSAGADKKDPADSEENAVKSGEEKGEENAKANGEGEKKADAKDAGKKDKAPVDPAAEKAKEAEPTKEEAAAAKTNDGPPREKNDSEKDRERMVRIASVSQEAIENNEKKLDEIK